MHSPDLRGLTATYRKAPSAWWATVYFVAALVGAFVCRHLSHDAPLEVRVIALIAYVLVSGIIGLSLRRLQAAVRLTESGVQVRKAASRWHLIDWDEVVSVDARPDPTRDPLLHLRGGGVVQLHGMVPAIAELLSQRLDGECAARSEPPDANA